ncbi:hypothetical protein [Streptomyces sp. 900116325]
MQSRSRRHLDRRPRPGDTEHRDLGKIDAALHQGLSRNPWRAHDDSHGTSPRCRNA